MQVVEAAMLMQLPQETMETVKSGIGEMTAGGVVLVIAIETATEDETGEMIGTETATGNGGIDPVTAETDVTEMTVIVTVTEIGGMIGIGTEIAEMTVTGTGIAIEEGPRPWQMSSGQIEGSLQHT